jgi:hypothetical protein
VLVESLGSSNNLGWRHQQKKFSLNAPCLLLVPDLNPTTKPIVIAFRTVVRTNSRGESIMRATFFRFITLVGFLITPQMGCAQSIPSASASEAPKPSVQVTRTVKAQVLTSAATPAIRLEFDKKFKYVGSQTFILYDVATAEQHFFVDADGQGGIKRFFWVQFEGYLPNNTHSYDYKSTKVVNIGGLDFIADAYARNIKTNPSRANSDASRARAFMEGKGYHLASDNVMSQRLVHLVDQAKRNELMIIYTEDLAGIGLTAADLAPNGTAAARWNSIATGLLERALKNMKLTR